MTKLGFCAVAALFAAVASPALAAPQCVEMRFFDAKGVILPVNPPIVGIMIGDGPLFEGSPPQFSKFEPGRFLPCPDALLASTRKAFQDFCTSDQRRKQAAEANGVDISVISKRCTDLNATLTK
jgi:hypothetical protein